MKKVEAVIFDWAGTVVDFGSFAPTQIFVDAFKSAYNFDISFVGDGNIVLEQSIKPNTRYYETGTIRLLMGNE